MSKVSFNNSQSQFFKALKGKVDRYFAENKLPQHGTSDLFWKAGLLIAALVGFYVTLVFFTPPAPIAIVLCALMGLNFGLIGFNIMHEAGHHSFSKKGWMNNMLVYSLNVMGGNSYFWKLKHNIAHHTYTNIEGMDFDLDLQPALRMHHDQPHRSFHRFQHWYFIGLYSFSYIAWIFILDFVKYFTGKIAPHPKAEVKQMEPKEHVIFWLTKAAYLAVYIVIPVMVVGWLPVLIGFLISSFICGITISIVFQLAHVVEGPLFPTPDPETNRIEEAWAVHQVHTTANFATKSKLVSWMVGGLNFQVEHHLFPRISHIHYPAINKLLIETCKEHGVNYTEFPSVASAFKSHVSHLRKLGQQEEVFAEPELALAR